MMASVIGTAISFSTQNAYAGNGFGASENSENLGGTGFDTITDVPCPDVFFSSPNFPRGCFDYEIDPVSIFYDPTAGAWHKHLQDPDSDCQSPICTITETIFIAPGGPDWNDWHEILFEPNGATWIDAKVTINPGLGEIVLTDSGDNIVIDDDTVWIFFDEPLPVGTELLIEKTWELSGATPDPFGDLDGPGSCTTATRASCLHPLGEVTILQFPSIPRSGTAVGGDIIPLDTTMVLAAGAQYTAAWMIPVIVSGIGFAIVIARKF